jgi:hypothetical protein
MADSLSKPRVIYYLGKLIMIGGWLQKDFGKATKADIERVMRNVNSMDYTEWTKKDYRVALKKFYRWLRGIEEPGVYPPEVSWIKTDVSTDRQDLPNNLPDETDVKKMIEVADQSRDKALIASLYESGCRVGEIASLRIGHVNFDEYGAYMVVKGKTGSRRIRLVFSAPILASWINVHPDKENPDAPLWVVVGTTKNLSKKGKTGGYKYDWSYELKYPASHRKEREGALPFSVIRTWSSSSSRGRIGRTCFHTALNICRNQLVMHMVHHCSHPLQRNLLHIDARHPRNTVTHDTIYGVLILDLICPRPEGMP